jgi:hypothetical protein
MGVDAQVVAANEVRVCLENDSRETRICKCFGLIAAQPVKANYVGSAGGQQSLIDTPGRSWLLPRDCIQALIGSG